jgi:TetR/AcrR family transcriptional regulator, ethionamide resistance regulator
VAAEPGNSAPENRPRMRGRPRAFPVAEMATFDQVIKVAGDLFAEVGFEAATIAEIARRAHIDRKAIYYHFDSKLGLLRAYGDLVIAPLIEFARWANEDPDPASRVVSFVLHAVSEATADRGTVIRFVMADWSAPSGVNPLAERVTWLRQQGILAYAQGNRLGIWQIGEPSQAAHLLEALCYGALVAGHSTSQVECDAAHLLRSFGMAESAIPDAIERGRTAVANWKAQRAH